MHCNRRSVRVAAPPRNDAGGRCRLPQAHMQSHHNAIYGRWMLICVHGVVPRGLSLSERLFAPWALKALRSTPQCDSWGRPLRGCLWVFRHIASVLRIPGILIQCVPTRSLVHVENIFAWSNVQLRLDQILLVLSNVPSPAATVPQGYRWMTPMPP